MLLLRLVCVAAWAMVLAGMLFYLPAAAGAWFKEMLLVKSSPFYETDLERIRDFSTAWMAGPFYSSIPIALLTSIWAVPENARYAILNFISTLMDRRGRG